MKGTDKVESLEFDHRNDQGEGGWAAEWVQWTVVEWCG